MVDFTLTPGQENVRGMIHWFAESQIRPLSMQADRDERYPDEFLLQLVALGLGAGNVPRELGGEGDGLGEEPDAKKTPQANRLAVIASEELAWGDGAVLLNIPGPGLGGPPVRFMATPEQKERFFGVFRDRTRPHFGAYGLTEPGAGSDVAGIATTAVRDGDHYVLNGTKCYISNGARADWVVVFASVDRSLGRTGHRAFVVERGTPGFRVGRLEHKMGLRATETAELVFEDCRVPVENLLGGEAHYESKEGFMGAMKTFDYSRPMVAAMAIGIARAAHEYAVDFVRDNYPVTLPGGRVQTLRARLGEMSRRIDAARMLVWKAAWMADAGIPNTREASMAKAWGAQVAVQACTDAVGVMGAHGIHRGHLVEKWFRDIKVFDIFEGTGQIQRVVIARRIIDGLKGF